MVAHTCKSSIQRQRWEDQGLKVLLSYNLPEWGQSGLHGTLSQNKTTHQKKSLNISYCATCYSWVFVRKNEQNGAHTFWWELRWPWNFSLEGFLPTRLGCPSFPVNQHVSKPATATWKKWRQLLQGLVAVGKARVTDKMLVQQRCCTSDLSSGLFFFFTKWAILPLPPLSWGYRCVT